jgi:hypothetical protein
VSAPFVGSVAVTSLGAGGLNNRRMVMFNDRVRFPRNDWLRFLWIDAHNRNPINASHLVNTNDFGGFFRI